MSQSPKKRKTVFQPDETYIDVENSSSNPSNQIIPVPSVNCPSLPRWAIERPFLSSSFLTSTSQFVRERTSNQNMRVKMVDLKMKVQEIVFTEELLSVLLGFETRHIRCVKDESFVHRCRFILNPDTRHHPTLGHLVNRILPVGSNYANLVRYVETHNVRYDCGKVVHALCASIKHFLKQYMELVTHLETLFRVENLTLHKLVYHLQPAMKTLDVLSRLIREEERRGGALLRFLHQQSICMSGDSQVAKVFEYLLEKVSQPYFDMLSRWIYDGEVQDPYEEFMIREDKTISKSALRTSQDARFWDNRYQLRPDHTPLFLERFSHVILTTGKYLNIIRETHENKEEQIEEEAEQDFSDDEDEDEENFYELLSEGKLRFQPTSTPEEEEEEEENELMKRLEESDNNRSLLSLVPSGSSSSRLSYTNQSQLLQSQIERAYHFASQRLLQLVMEEYDLLSQLRAMKRYFFLDRGDWLIIFFDVSERFLVNTIPKIRVKHLQALFEHAVKNSVCRTDRLRKRVKVVLKEESLKSYLLEIDRVRKISDMEFEKEKKKQKIKKTKQILEEKKSDSSSSSSSRKTTTTTSNNSLRGIESFCLDVAVPFPLSVVMNRRVISKYQVLFRHLFYCKYVERAIQNCWMKLRSLKFLVRNHAQTIGKMQILHQKMLYFIRQFQYYMIEVIEKQFTIMTQKMKMKECTRNIDDVMKHHDEYIESLLKVGLLTVNVSVFKSLSIILTNCLNFSVFLIQFVRKLRIGSNSSSNGSLNMNNMNMFTSSYRNNKDYVRRLSEIVKKETEKKQFQNHLNNYWNNFEKAMKALASNIKRYFRERDSQELMGLLKVIQESFGKKNMF